MIDPINKTGNGSTGAVSVLTGAQASDTGGFSAAIEAAQRDADRKASFAAEMQSIHQKGFSNWVRDTQVDNLKEELRRKVMAEMGVDAKSMSTLSASVAAALEKQIEDEVQRRMEEAEREQKDGTKKTAATGQKSSTDAAKQGNDIKVIPALIWPGGASVF
jgi:hypothetical protein